MISAAHLTIQLGSRTLLGDVSFHIGPHDRIGLVGSNGSGKTTLLKTLAGEFPPFTGEILRARYATVGYLPQEGVSLTGRTLYAEAELAFASILELEASLEAVRQRMEELDEGSPELPDLVAVFGELQHKLEASEAFRRATLIERVLGGLGFSAQDFTRRTEEFSGGWQMRIALARLLLLQPSLLLLDEPTNHLDLDSLEWLEQFIAGYDGSVMIVSHDQRFLDNLTTRTFELSMGTLAEYAASVSAAMVEKARRREQQLAARKNQQEQIKQTQRFIERFRYKATKARQVQSRIKALERMEMIEVEGEEREIRFAFPPAPPSGRVVMELSGIRKRYGTLQVFEDLSFEIERGDRIAFVGVNGAGKSTLARIIAGVEPHDAGHRTVGHNVTIAYFAQHQAEELDPRRTVLETVESVATGEIRKHLRSVLGSFLFSGDDVFKTVRVLSGGEKSRLALAKMLLQPANLLIMDEPTNHLDSYSKAVLQDALSDVEGSIVIVSHDRDFLDPLVTKVVEFKEGRVRTFLGNVSDFTQARSREGADRQEPRSKAVSSTVLTEKERKRREAELRQDRYEKARPIQEALAHVEASIEALEATKAELETLMGQPEFYRDAERVKESAARYKVVQEDLVNAYHRWGTLTRQLEDIQGDSARREKTP